MGTTARAASGFVGRTREIARVRSVVDGAQQGRMGPLIVSGDAGVGKTRLVDAACAQAVSESDEVLVLRGVCLPMGASTVPLMPLRTGLRRLPDGIPRPALDDDARPGGAPVVLDEWLEVLCAERPVVLVVDDLHWSDPGSLDVLTYLLAGPPDRRLAVLMTLRRGEVGVGHPMQRWLADVRRMPCLTELSLPTFDRAATRDQLQELLGSPPHESLVSDVHTRSGGNAYLNRLLVEDLSPGERHLGADLPADLRDAVLRPWHRLSARGRELVVAVAVGGEVASGRALVRATGLAGVTPSEATSLLREAVDQGVLDVTADGGHWFHHPLQAEALESGLAGEERRQLHAAFARACEKNLSARGDATSAMTRLAATTHVAEHHARAGNHGQAYLWSLRAADLAAALDDAPAELRLLARLVELRGHVKGVGESRVDLLDRLRRAAARVGEFETELGAVESLLSELDESRHPLMVAELLVRQEHLRFSTGRGFLRIDPLEHAVELSSPFPESWQHPYALAELAHAALWADRTDAFELADTALARARSVGHPRALAYACAAAAMGAEFAGRSGGLELAARGAESALEAGDWWAFVHASLWEANASGAAAPLKRVRAVEARRRQMEALGAPHPYLAWVSAALAADQLVMGEWRRCTELLRVALGSDPGGLADASSRLSAAHLAVLQGRQHEAEDHLARADELFAETTGFLPFEFDAVRARVRLGAGDAEGAFEAAMAGALSAGVPPTLCEWLCPLAARALGDLADAAREGGQPVEPVLGRLEDLLERFPHVIADLGPESPAYQARLDGLDALYGGEVARARRSPGAADRWARAAVLLDGECPWDAAYAAFREAEAVLTEGERPRREAATLVRRAHALAADLRAESLLSEVRQLARSARIRLDDVGAEPSEPSGSRLKGLTTREGEILEHVVAGRTYGEIARALFVSEKTVSSHVSNLLRKTGASNRYDLARLARHRSAGDAGDPG